MKALIVDALKDFETFRELTQTIPGEVLAAEAANLTQGQQQIFQEYCSRIHFEQLKVGDIVHFTNPNNLAQFRKEEGIDLVIDRILEAGDGSLALCKLPSGTEETFGLRTLKRKESKGG